MAIQLEFAWNNNTTEYEGLLQGLKKAIDMKVKNLKVFGDSDNCRSGKEKDTLQFATPGKVLA